MAHLIESAVYSAREGAGWTGLGQEIPAAIANDPAKIAELLGATYTVGKRECFYKTLDGEFRHAPGRAVIIREDTGAMLGITSDNRNHLQNRQPINFVEAFRDELAAHRMEFSHGAVLAGGSRIAVCALLPPELDIYISGTDRVKNYVTLSGGYDGKNGTKCSKGTIRVVCSNTLTFSLAQAARAKQLKTIRSSTVIETNTLAELIKNVADMVKEEREVYTALANTNMSTDDVARYFANVLSIKVEDLGKRDSKGAKLVSTKSENMLRELASAYASAPGAAIGTGTAWGVLNAVTYYATHVKTCRDTSGSGANAARVASNLNGDAAQLKLRALALASAMVAA